MSSRRGVVRSRPARANSVPGDRAGTTGEAGREGTTGARSSPRVPPPRDGPRSLRGRPSARHPRKASSRAGSACRSAGRSRVARVAPALKSLRCDGDEGGDRGELSIARGASGAGDPRAARAHLAGKARVCNLPPCGCGRARPRRERRRNRIKVDAARSEPRAYLARSTLLVTPPRRALRVHPRRAHVSLWRAGANTLPIGPPPSANHRCELDERLGDRTSGPLLWAHAFFRRLFPYYFQVTPPTTNHRPAFPRRFGDERRRASHVSPRPAPAAHSPRAREPPALEPRRPPERSPPALRSASLRASSSPPSAARPARRSRARPSPCRRSR